MLKKLQLKLEQLYNQKHPDVTLEEGKFQVRDKNQLTLIKANVAEENCNTTFYVPNVKKDVYGERLPENCQFRDIRNMRTYIYSYLYNFHDISKLISYHLQVYRN